MNALVNNTFNELVFKDRNKLFGGYFIRKMYSSNVLNAVLLSVALFSLALVSPLIYNNYFKTKEKQETVQMVEVKLEDIPSIDPNEPPPPPAPKIELPQMATIKFLPPVIKEDKEVIEEEVPEQAQLEKAVISSSAHEGDDAQGLNELIVNGTGGNGIVEEKEEILTFVSEMPEFKGGHDKLQEFFQKHIIYPDHAKDNNIEGTVWISFVVHKDGSLSDFKVVKSIGHGCDEEALRVAKMMPHWNPGKANGVAKTVSRKCPIAFALQN